jgi:hypothetical protein
LIFLKKYCIINIQKKLRNNKGTVQQSEQTQAEENVWDVFEW